MHFRMTPEEMAVISRKAKAAGKPKSRWLRELAMDAAEPGTSVEFLKNYPL